MKTKTKKVDFVLKIMAMLYQHSILAISKWVTLFIKLANSCVWWYTSLKFITWEACGPLSSWPV